MYANWFLQVNVCIMDSTIPLTLTLKLKGHLVILLQEF
jgi:hypothetical protein